MTRDHFIAIMLFHASLYVWAIDRLIQIKLDMMGIPKDPGEHGETA